MKKNNSFIQLQRARSLELPTREAVLTRDYSVKEFWDNNQRLLSSAWKEWEESEEIKLNLTSGSLIDEKLHSYVESAWENPEQEGQISELLEEVSPGVFLFNFFNPEKLKELRSYLEKVSNAQIPLRQPYGIVLNRNGAMLDPRSEGYLAAPSFQSFYQELMDKYMRPIARFLYPEITGFDTQTFGFSIQYQPGMDTSIRMHTDASAVTLNINMNLPGEEFTGSEVDFHDPNSGKINRVSFKPGTAMIHRGSVAHAAQPITSGERSNLVLWLYGDRMLIPRYASREVEINAKERWSTPTTPKDEHAPF